MSTTSLKSRPLSRVQTPARRRLRSPRIPATGIPPSRQPTRDYLLADLRLRHETLMRKYEDAVKRADVAAGLRDRLVAQIRAVEKAIDSLA